MLGECERKNSSELNGKNYQKWRFSLIIIKIEWIGGCRVALIIWKHFYNIFSTWLTSQNKKKTLIKLIEAMFWMGISTPLSEMCHVCACWAVRSFILSGCKMAQSGSFHHEFQMKSMCVMYCNYRKSHKCEMSWMCMSVSVCVCVFNSN